MRSKRRQGHPLKETADIKLWEKEFEKMSLKDHEQKLRRLGLDEEDIAEFKAGFGSQSKKKKE